MLEKTALGVGQTLASQGIIHGGTKYALTGKLTGSSEAVRAMPERWKQHLSASAQPDLSACKMTTRCQLMWDLGGISARVSSFFASKVMSSRVRSMKADERPAFLRDKAVYELQEPVLDVHSLLSVLSAQNNSALFRAEVLAIKQSGDSIALELSHNGELTTIESKSVVSCAGAGNEILQQHPMQRRPLHMVMVKGGLPELWGHVIEANANPVLTITTHHDSSGDVVWYIGGQIAEDGINLDRAALIERSRRELQAMFPMLDWTKKQWATLVVDLAEGLQPGNVRPDQPVIQREGGVITVWPTKLVFAPLVADEVLAMVSGMRLEPGADDAVMPELPAVEVGGYPWDRAEWI